MEANLVKEEEEKPTIMEANLIKEEEEEDDFDLHLIKTIICPKKKPRRTLWNVKSKNFKNGNIRQKTLNKLTNKTPLEPEASSTIKNILPEKDLDTEPSLDHNEDGSSDHNEDQLGYFGDEGRQLDYDSEDFDMEEKEEEEDPFILPTGAGTFTQFLFRTSPNGRPSALFSCYFGGPDMYEP